MRHAAIAFTINAKPAKAAKNAKPRRHGDTEEMPIACDRPATRASNRDASAVFADFALIVFSVSLCLCG
jgi:hypothetical protein